MTASENASVIRDGYRAFAAGDLAAVASALAPDIVWHMPGTSPIAGTYHGLAEVSSYLAELAELTAGSYGIELADVLASEENVVALVREKGRRDGKRLDAPEAHVWRMADGKAAEFWAYRADGDAVDEFWS